MNRVIVITGASDGIGAALARHWAQSQGGDAALVLAARNEEALSRVAEDCRRHGAQALAVRCDVTREDDCRALIATARQAHGRIDTLVNNAGMSAHARLDEVDDLRWYEDLMRVNLWGAVWCTHAALPDLKAAGGRLVAVSSLAGLVGVPGRTAYSATKFAMTGFFEALRTELQPEGVSVTIAYPGVVDTRIRYRGYGPDGRPAGRSGLDERGAMPVDTCARLIAEGADARRREVVMTAQGRLGRWLKLLAPGVVDHMARRALAREAAR